MLPGICPYILPPSSSSYVLCISISFMVLYHRFIESRNTNKTCPQCLRSFSDEALRHLQALFDRKAMGESETTNVVSVSEADRTPEPALVLAMDVPFNSVPCTIDMDGVRCWEAPNHVSPSHASRPLSRSVSNAALQKATSALPSCAKIPTSTHQASIKSTPPPVLPRTSHSDTYTVGSRPKVDSSRRFVDSTRGSNSPHM
eukprot:Rmarinus@m.16191